MPIVAFGILAAAALAVYLLLNRRTRAAFLIMTLIVVIPMTLGFVGFRGSEVQQSAIVVQTSEANAAQRQALAEARSEVLKKQRLASRMPDSTMRGALLMQRSRDGSMLETYSDGMQIKQTLRDDRLLVRPANGTRPAPDAQSAEQRVQAEMRAGVLKHQRLASTMPDSTMRDAWLMRRSSDGSMLETYRDGMQIKQTLNGDRLLVRRARGIRSADGSFGPEQQSASAAVSTHSAVKSWLLFAPLAAIAIALMAFRRRCDRGPATFGWIAVLGLAMFIGGLYFLRQSSSHVLIAQTPVPSRTEIELQPPEPPTAPLAEDYQEVVEEDPHDGVPNQESLEKLWARLTEPRIRLQETAKKTALASHAAAHAEQELAAAARLVLSASMPGADPFTQGWLVHAAKAILEASAKAQREHAAKMAESKTLKGAEAAAEAHAHDHIEEAMPADIAHPHDVDEDWQHAAAPAESSDRHEAAVQIIRPVKMVTSPKDRPAWLDNPPTLVGNTRRVVVSTDPYSTIEECYAQLQEKLRQAVQERIAEKARDLNRGQSVFVPPLEWMGVTTDYILRELCPEGEYIETVNASFGEMKRAHALLEFTEVQDELLLDRWRAYARRESVHVVGILSTLVVGGLAFVYGLLKVDTWTRGYYTKRLFLGVPAAIIGLVLLFAIFA
jgi:uncharacterized membrane protein YgdD (TMEM256/DUF423 family)